MTEKIFEEYFVKVYEIDHFDNYKENKKNDKNGHEHILFKIDVCFTKYLLAVETYEQNHEGRDFIFEEKRQEALEEKLSWKLIRIKLVIPKVVIIQTMKLVKYKYLSVNLKIKTNKTRR